jgi:hypothetical protein
MSTDFITTIDSDDEVESLGESSRPTRDIKQQDLQPEFRFDLAQETQGLDLWGGDEIKASNGVEVSSAVVDTLT